MRTHSDGRALQRAPFVHDFSINDGHYSFSVDRNELDRAMAQLTELGHHRADGDACVARGPVPARVPRDAAMSTTTLAPHARVGMKRADTASPFTGVGSLVRLALRRDRVRLSVWIAALTLMMVYAPNAIKLAYPDEAQRGPRAST